MTLTWLADELRAAGLVVVEHPGWTTHARPGGWDPRFGVVHATAAPRAQADDVQVRVVRDGRADLPGPIANAVIDRQGRWHVVSAGRCNSTLAGTAGPYRGKGNTYALSTEACNDNRGEPWPDVQYASYVRGWAAWCRRLGWNPGRLVGHKEHTPGRKTDPTFDMDRFRADVAAVLAGEDDDMQLTDKVNLRTDGDVKYSAKTATVEGILASTNYYVLQARDVQMAQLAGLRAELAGLRGVVEQLAAAIAQAGGSVDTTAILRGVDERVARVRDEVAAELARRLAG